MKIIRKFLIISMFLISLLAIGTVSASENVSDVFETSDFDDAVPVESNYENLSTVENNFKDTETVENDFEYETVGERDFENVSAAESDFENVSAAENNLENNITVENDVKNSEVLSVAGEAEPAELIDAGNYDTVHLSESNLLGMSDNDSSIHGDSIDTGVYGNAVTDWIIGLLNGTVITNWINSFLISAVGFNLTEVIDYLNIEYGWIIEDILKGDFEHIVKKRYNILNSCHFTDITIGNGLITAVLVDTRTIEPIANATVYCSKDDEVFIATTDANGTLSIEATNELVNLFYGGDDDHIGFGVFLNLTNINSNPKKTKTIIKGKDFNQVAIDYNAGERGKYFVVQLKDVNGKVLAKKTVKIGFNGAEYTVTTNATGHAKLQINLARAGLYTFTVAFLGDNKYETSFTVYKITVTKKSTSISASAKSFKASAKKKSYTVTLKTSKNPVDGKTYLKAGKKVTLKLKGKTYTAKINSKGKATFKLKIKKKGKFAASVKYAGDDTYAASSKSVKITIK